MEERIRQLVLRRLEELGWDAPEGLLVERPRDPRHGDWASNAALALARTLGRKPREVADDLVRGWRPDPELVAEVAVAGPGFLNFRLREDVHARALRSLLRDPASYLRSDAGAGRAVIVEFVSSNPTGPLHIGHGRNAALGDAVANLLENAGWRVTREYYYNDAGRQMEMLGRSLMARYAQITDPAHPFPEEGYEGEYLVDLARELREREGPDLLAVGVDDALPRFQAEATRAMMASIAEDLERFGVRFDSWFLESRLYAEGRLDDTLARLRQRGAVEEREGAVWFRASAYGDDEDRVLVKSSGQPTYFLPDVAYHIDKHDRGFQRAVNVWGADHHGYVPRMQAALTALGFEPDWLHCIVYQAVTLMEGGQAVKLSTRKARFVTLRELMDEVGADVARWFLLMRRADTHLTFDLDVARAQSEENPVYYVQYAHARVASVFGRLRERTDGARGASPGDAQLAGATLELLTHEREGELLRLLADAPAVARDAAEAVEPHRVAAFLERLAKEFHAWYHEARILGEEPALSTARLALARGVQLVVGSGLGLLGISAPETMEREAPVPVETGA